MLCPRVDWGNPRALPLTRQRLCLWTPQGTSSLDPFARFSWSHAHALPACLSTVHPHCPPYPQVTAKTSNRSVHCEGFQRAIAKPFGRSRRSEIPLQHEKSSRIGKKHTPKSASRTEVVGKNRKFPYRPFYHENPHLKSPKIPPIPCQAPHGASK